jgi:hypothetical protein
MKEVVTMANKKTVVQMYEELLTIEGLTQEQKDFLNKRIEITKKKNANRSTELTPKQKEKVAETEGYKNSVIAVMKQGVQYSPTDLLKAVDNPAISSTQKLTPLLTALVDEKRLIKTAIKGRNVYSLPAVSADEGE